MTRREIPAITRGTPAPAPRRRTAALVAALVGLLGVMGFAVYLVWANTYPRGPLFDPIASLPDPLPAADAELNARRITVAFADTQEVWRRYVEREPGRAYRTARLELFTRGAQTPCAPGVITAGPFHCAAEATLAFDLMFAEALSRRLRRETEIGAALLVAQAAGAHVADQLDDPGTPPRATLAATLTADCLAGVWAEVRGGRIGPVEPGFYGRLIQTARNTAADLARIAPRIAPDLDPFRPGRIADREAAFQAGYRTGEPAICAVAGTQHAGG